MREIKFRAWDKEGDCFVNHTLFLTIGGEEPISGMTLIDEDLFVLQQYTGLKDKNEKEIYEGDLLLSAFCRDKENPVEVSWGDKNNGWNVNHLVITRLRNPRWGIRNGQEGPLLKIHQQSYEVVGNIFEGVDK